MLGNHSNNIIANNISYGDSSYMIQWHSSLVSVSGVQVRNNIIYNGVIDGGQGKPSSGITYSSNQEYANPLLTDVANKDFSLTSSSPAIDAGTSSGAVKEVFDTFQSLYGIDLRKDKEGKARTGAWDIGAYER